MDAYIYPDLLDRIDAFFKGKEGHRTDPQFLELCERIAGKTVELTFTGPDAFERSDNNYWLPDCCWEPAPPTGTSETGYQCTGLMVHAKGTFGYPCATQPERDGRGT